MDQQESGSLGEYLKLPAKQYPPRTERETAEGKFWRGYRAPVSAQQIGAVTSIDFCESAPYNFAVTSSTRVTVYDNNSRKAKRNFSRFRDVAYSGSFRSDGQLLVAGGETGIVQVFDANSRVVLRQLKGHTRPVHYTRFGRDKLHVLSAGDDKSVRWWDVAAQAAETVVEEHTDYVRCGSASPVNDSLWATGSYDHTVRLWDLRTQKSVLQLQHSHPLESVLFFPAGGLIATAAGNHVCIWDVLGGGRLLQRLSNHQKTVTALSLAPPPSVGPANRALGPRLLTGSLDCHLKVYELDTFRVTHASRYADPILSLGISANGTTLAVGMASGLLSTRQRKQPPPGQLRSAGILAGLPGEKRRKRPVSRRPLQASSYRYFLRGRSEKAAAEDFLVAQRKRAHLAPHDRLLRKFRYADALTAALHIGRAEVVMAVMEELVARGGLRAALAGRAASSLEPLLGFVVKHVTNPRHSTLLVPVAHRVLDIYGNVLGLSPAIDHMVAVLREKVLVEVRLQEALLALQGLLQPLLQASTAQLGVEATI